MPNTTNYYDSIAEILKLLFEEDDMMSQDNLFEVQDKVANLALRIALNEKKGAKLVKAFPYLYQIQVPEK